MNVCLYDTVVEVKGCDPSLLRSLKRALGRNIEYVEHKDCYKIKDLDHKLVQKLIKEESQMSIFETSNRDKAEAAGEVFKFLFPEEDFLLDVKNGVIYSNDMKFSYKNGSLRMMVFCPVCLQEVYSRPIRRPADISSEDQMRIDKHDCIDVNA